MDPPHIVARDPDCPLHGVRSQPDFFEEKMNVATLEEIRRIPFAPSYQITESGKVRRIGGSNFLRACALKRGGYLAVALSENGRLKTWPVHKLVAAAFLDKQPSSKHEIAHNDGDKLNNHWRNLRWATRAENERDKIAHGRSNRGERNGGAKLTDAQARQVILRSKSLPRSSGGRRIRKGEIAKLAIEFGVTASAIWQIINGYRRVPA